MMADVVAFDQDGVVDRSTFARPRQHSEGVHYVAVNGELVVDNGAITDARPGRALRSRAAPFIPARLGTPLDIDLLWA